MLPVGVHVVALGPLLDWAAAVVPPRQRAATPVFLFGTAGLRRLGLPAQAALLVQVRHALEASPFKYAYCPPHLCCVICYSSMSHDRQGLQIGAR